ncbi:MAG: hypothetical protein DWQ10_05945 [Calditrichaeota bacterium]|nr:MAG: hypothetical protein DWQ10_05945 [Calditrichota bacterium]
MGSEKKRKSILEVSEGIGKILIWLGLFGIGFMAYKMGKRDLIASISDKISECFSERPGPNGPPPPPLPPPDSYVILVGYFDTYDRALNTKKKLAKIRTNSSISRHRGQFIVMVDHFTTKAQADYALTTLRRNGFRRARLLSPRRK